MIKNQKLHFVAIYSGSDSCAIALRGLHIHAMPSNTLRPQTCENNIYNFPSRTIVQYGRIDKLMAGELDSGLSEDSRITSVGGDFGLAFHMVNVNGIEKVSIKENIFIEGRHYGGDSKFIPANQYVLVQLFSLENSIPMSITSANNFSDLKNQIETYLSARGEVSQFFAAEFTGVLTTEKDLEQNEGYVIDFSGVDVKEVELTSLINVVPIEHWLVWNENNYVETNITMQDDGTCKTFVNLRNADYSDLFDL